MESKYIHTTAGTLHAKTLGSGEVTLLIHGRSIQVNSWRTWEKNIAALAAHNRVYALDMLGYGESDKPVPHPGASAQAKALVELLQVEGIARANLVGLSWGGSIAQLVVRLAPERIDRLVLVDSGCDKSERGMQALKHITCPTLIVWDEDDAVIPVDTANVLGGAIPNSRVRIFKRDERDVDADPENRHWSQVSHSQVWNRQVAEFLAN